MAYSKMYPVVTPEILVADLPNTTTTSTFVHLVSCCFSSAAILILRDVLYFMRMQKALALKMMLVLGSGLQATGIVNRQNSGVHALHLSHFTCKVNAYVTQHEQMRRLSANSVFEIWGKIWSMVKIFQICNISVRWSLVNVLSKCLLNLF